VRGGIVGVLLVVGPGVSLRMIVFSNPFFRMSGCSG
jgi:hypothetical protein